MLTALVGLYKCMVMKENDQKSTPVKYECDIIQATDVLLILKHCENNESPVESSLLSN